MALGLTVAAHQGVAAEGTHDACRNLAAVQQGRQLEVLTLQEAACFLRVEPPELERLVLRGSVPAREAGNQWRFSRTALHDWLNEIDESALRAATGKGTHGGQLETEEDREPIGEAPEEDELRVAFLRAQHVLLDPGEVTLEPAVFYARDDTETLVLAGAGLATVATSRRPSSDAAMDM
jgi:excisionase family DNA binding protein